MTESDFDLPDDEFASLTDAQLAHTIACLPRTLNTYIVRQAARFQNVRVLDAVAKQGLFDFVEGDYEKNVDDTFFADEEIPMVAALVSFLLEATSTAHEEVIGQSISARCQMQGRQIPFIKPEFAQAFANYVDRFMLSFETWNAQQQDQHKEGQRQDLYKERHDCNALAQARRYGITLNVLLAGACAMDLDAAVKKIMGADSGLVMEAVLKPSIIGKPKGYTAEENKELHEFRLLPWALCLEFGSQKSYKVVRRCGLEPVFLAGEIYAARHTSVIHEAGFAKLLSLGVIGTTPGMLKEMVNRINAPNNQGTPQCLQAQKSLVKKLCSIHRLPDLKEWVDQLVHLGVHRYDMKSCLQAACQNRGYDFIRKIHQDIDWRVHESEPHLMVQLLDCNDNSPLGVRMAISEQLNALQLDMLDWIQEAGHWDDFMKNAKGVVAGLPGHSAADKVALAGYFDVMVKMAEMGYPMDAKNSLGNTLTQTIDLNSSSTGCNASTQSTRLERLEKMKSVVRSCGARQAANAALLEFAPSKICTSW